MIKLLKIFPVVFLIGTVISGVMYKRTSLDICFTLAITLGTVAYHFIMRWLVAFVYNQAMHNRADYRKRWYQVGETEKMLYEKLKVKKWKKRMPTYDPGIFDPRRHTWNQIAQATCQAELIHETIALLSLAPIMAGAWLGGYPAFIVTSVVAALFDLTFAVIQRYNRERILKLVK